MSGKFLLVLVTTPGREDAQSMARIIVQERLAACVNIIDGIDSIYRWEGKVEEGSEALMLIKTRKELLDPLKVRVKELHSYSVPEVVALDISGGSAGYLAWLAESTLR